MQRLWELVRWYTESSREMIDLSRLETLASLVKEARAADKAAFDVMEQAKIEWKSVNETLTDRQKVLDEYVRSFVTEITHE